MCLLFNAFHMLNENFTIDIQSFVIYCDTNTAATRDVYIITPTSVYFIEP